MGTGAGSYGTAERLLAKWLDRFPRARRLAKGAYQRLNYLLCARGRARPAELHPGLELLTPTGWAGARETAGERFFGYYDKSPWSPDMQRMLLHRPRGDQLDVLVVDRRARTTRVLGATRTWNAQQGSQAQWLPSAGGRIVLFNDVVGRQLGCRLVEWESGDARFVPWPIQTLHPRRPEALTLNYRRLHRIRPEYGYAVEADNFSTDEPLERDGIWRVDLEANRSELVLSLAVLTAHAPRPEMNGATHKVNHLLYAPSGDRFVFVHRWKGSAGRFSRLYAARPDGAKLRLLLDERMVSHYHWRDDDHLLVWARTARHGDRYYLVNVNTGSTEIVGAGVLDGYGDGHPSFSPDRAWIITDTYPDRARQRHLLLFHVASEALFEVGRFFAPWAFDGPVRCDLHPRWSPDGFWVSFDSAHEGLRRSYVVQLDALLKRTPA